MLRMGRIAGAQASGSPRTAKGRTAAAFVVALTLCTTGIFSTVAHADPASDLASERAQAEQLQAEIAANGTRVSILDEQYLKA
jgi:hypothetical protein